MSTQAAHRKRSDGRCRGTNERSRRHRSSLPYAQRALELEPQNIQAAKFMAYRYTESRKFAEALPYVRLAAQGAHPDSIYIVMLKQTLAALGKNSEAEDAGRA